MLDYLLNQALAIGDAVAFAQQKENLNHKAYRQRLVGGIVFVLQRPV